MAAASYRSQFWPATKGSRSSDADTVHMKVDPQTSFLFASSPATTPKTTTKFVDAHVFDHGKKNVITSKSEIKIRLQGLDAPELHFPITVPRDPSKTGKGNEFRQPFGARAASALLDFLKGFVAPGGGSRIFATFLTHIDHPGDAIDSHGRFVGDIIVGTAASTNINTWLVENGWAYPLFYDSMTEDEIRTLLAAWKVGRAIAGRPGKAVRRPLQPFDPARTVKNAALPDNGALNIPKLFRRQATFWAQLPGPLTPAGSRARRSTGPDRQDRQGLSPELFPRPHREARPQEAHPARQPDRRQKRCSIRPIWSSPDPPRCSTPTTSRSRRLDVSGKRAVLT